MALAVAGALGMQAVRPHTGRHITRNVETPENMPLTTIHYKVNYQVAFFMKTAARGTVQMQAHNGQFYATLNGHSIPWGGRVYTVSDTLRMSVMPGRGPAYMRLKETNRSGWYYKPFVNQLNDKTFSLTDPANYRNTAGQGQLSCSDDTMEAVSISTDMLSMFYVFRELDFAKLQTGQQFTIPIKKPDGSEQYAYITYVGPSEYEGVPSYKLICEYSYQGRRSHYPVTCQVNRSNHVLLSMAAHLDIGQIEMVQEQ